jgi:hypothetical protein
MHRFPVYQLTRIRFTDFSLIVDAPVAFPCRVAGYAEFERE